MHHRSTSIKALLTALLLSLLQAGWARPAPISEDCTAERVSGTWAGASSGGRVLAIVHLNQDGTASVNLWNNGYLRSRIPFDRKPAGIDERSETYSGKWRMLNRKGSHISDIELDVLPSTHSSRMPGWAFDVIALCSIGGVEIFKIELTSSSLDTSVRIEVYLSRPRRVLDEHDHYERFLDALRVLR
jgi:hypothetical protein